MKKIKYKNKKPNPHIKRKKRISVSCTHNCSMCGRLYDCGQRGYNGYEFVKDYRIVHAIWDTYTYETEYIYA